MLKRSNINSNWFEYFLFLNLFYLETRQPIAFRLKQTSHRLPCCLPFFLQFVQSESHRIGEYGVVPSEVVTKKLIISYVFCRLYWFYLWALPLSLYTTSTSYQHKWLCKNQVNKLAWAAEQKLKKVVWIFLCFSIFLKSGVSLCQKSCLVRIITFLVQ